MDADLIDECIALSLAGKITFPEVVMKLAANGVERYMVDMVGFQKHAYGRGGEYHVAALWTQDMSPVAVHFEAAKVKDAITSIQHQEINYKTFLQQIMGAGCCHYEVYIDGKKVVYFGRNGDQHVELFPAVKP